VPDVSGPRPCASRPAGLPGGVGRISRIAGDFDGDHDRDQLLAYAELDTGGQPRAGAKEAAEEVAADPDDADARQSLRLHLKRLLTQDASLREQVVQLLDAGQASSVSVSGEVVQIGKYVVNLRKAHHIAIGDQAGVGSEGPESRPGNHERSR
jgi:hypothetical protein